MTILKEHGTPLISVVLPTYNRAYIIRRSIDSVLNQTYKNIELIIVDDCSKDNTAELINNYDDKRIRFIKLLKNQGSNAARNRGINEAAGDFIAFQDSDDAWRPEKLAVLMANFVNSENKAGVIFSKTRLIKFDGSTTIYPKFDKMPSDYHECIYIQNFVGTVALLVKKECLKSIGAFAEELPRLQDWDLSIRLSKITEFIFVNEVLVDAFHQKESISADGNKLVKALGIFREKYKSDVSKLSRNTKSRVLNKYGSLICREGMVSEGRKYFIESFFANPLNIRNLSQFAASLMGNKFYSFLVFKVLKKKLL